MTAPVDIDPDAPTGCDALGRRPRRRRWRAAALVVGAPLLVVVVALVGLRLVRPHAYAGTIMQAPTTAPPMDGLVWSDGSSVDLGEFAGDVVLVYFGYTYCPDVCPTTLTAVDRSIDLLDGDPTRVHTMMVSVDPERDDPASLGEYVRAFDPSFRGATGERAVIERVASTYGVFFARGEQYDDGGYAVDHTASLMGIDTDGHLRIVWPTTVTAEALAADLDELL